MKVKLRIYYTDGEVVNRTFTTLGYALSYLITELIEKKEFADKIEITID